MAAFIGSDYFGSKVLGGLIGVGSVVVALFIAAAFAAAPAPGSTMGFSHAQLEADRQMTQQMAVSVDPRMQGSMGAGSMLQRSANPAYVRALEDHIRQFDRMLGQVP